MTTTVLLNKFQRLISKNGAQIKGSNLPLPGQKPSLITKIFGCRHEDIGRPFTFERTAYRSCSDCGARRRFNPETLETYGNFYFPPVIKMGQD